MGEATNATPDGGSSDPSASSTPSSTGDGGGDGGDEVGPAPATDSGGDAASDVVPNPCGANLASDPTNCGACGHDCLGGVCTGGLCEPTLFTSNESGCRGVTVAGADLVWTREAANVIRKRPLAGGAMASDLFAATAPTDVTCDGAKQQCWSTNRSGQKLSSFATNGAFKWSLEPIGGKPTGIHVSGNDVFFTRQDEDSVSSIDLNADSSSKLRATGLNYPGDVHVDNGSIYIASSSGILSAPLATGTPVKNVSPTSRFKTGGGDLIHTALVVAGGTVWFTIDSLGIVASVPAAGGADAKVVAENQNSPQGITATADSLYWCNGGSGEIMRLAR